MSKETWKFICLYVSQKEEEIRPIVGGLVASRVPDFCQNCGTAWLDSPSYKKCCSCGWKSAGRQKTKKPERSTESSWPLGILGLPCRFFRKSYFSFLRLVGRDRRERFCWIFLASVLKNKHWWCTRAPLPQEINWVFLFIQQCLKTSSAQGFKFKAGMWSGVLFLKTTVCRLINLNYSSNFSKDF